MAKYKKTLMKEVNEEIAFEKDQEDLKERHNIEDENVIIVEKRDAAKFIIKTMIMIIRVVATILMVILAALGLMSIIYPKPREALLNILTEIMDSIIVMLGI